MSANVALNAPSDANGLKFRVMSSDVLVAQMEAMGASPQKMAFSEVYGGLQQGVVDGQDGQIFMVRNFLKYKMVQQKLTMAF